MPKARVLGGEIYYEESGEGEPLVFVSGLGGVGRYWQPQLPVFARRFKVRLGQPPLEYLQGIRLRHAASSSRRPRRC